MTRLAGVGLAIGIVLFPSLATAAARLDELGETGDLNPFDALEFRQMSGHANAASVAACGFVSDCAPTWGVVDLTTMEFFQTGRFSNAIFGLSPDGELAGGRGLVDKTVGPAVWDRQLGVTLLAESQTTRDSLSNHVADISLGGGSAAGTIDERPFFWMDGNVVQPAEFPSRRRGNAVGVSNDGMTFAGTTHRSRTSEAFVWSVGNPYMPLGFLEGAESSTASAVSADGKVVVGRSWGAALGQRAFTWSEVAGMEDIGDFIPTSVSGDGSVVVGYRYEERRQHAVVWDRNSGLRSFVDAMQDHGIDANALGWDFDVANSISDDGKVVLGLGRRNGRYTGWMLSVGDFEMCDLNADGNCDAIDVDALTTTSRDRILRSSFDLNDDRELDFQDRRIWVHTTMNSFFGDSNLDGKFSSSDLVAVFVAGVYEDDIALNSTWATGDWDGNGDFESDDIVLAFQDGGFEMGLRAAVMVVPEPSACLLLLAGLIGIAIRWPSRRQPNR